MTTTTTIYQPLQVFNLQIIGENIVKIKAVLLISTDCSLFSFALLLMHTCVLILKIHLVVYVHTNRKKNQINITVA